MCRAYIQKEPTGLPPKLKIPRNLLRKTRAARTKFQNIRGLTPSLLQALIGNEHDCCVNGSFSAIGVSCLQGLEMACKLTWLERAGSLCWRQLLQCRQCSADMGALQCVLAAAICTMLEQACCMHDNY